MQNNLKWIDFTEIKDLELNTEPREVHTGVSGNCAKRQHETKALGI